MINLKIPSELIIKNAQLINKEQGTFAAILAAGASFVSYLRNALLNLIINPFSRNKGQNAPSKHHIMAADLQRMLNGARPNKHHTMAQKINDAFKLVRPSKHHIMASDLRKMRQAPKPSKYHIMAADLKKMRHAPRPGKG